MGKNLYLVILKDKSKELRFYAAAKNLDDAVEKTINALHCEGNYDWSEADLKSVTIVAIHFGQDVFK